jgi:flagellar basal-body rod protein FlgF
VSDGIYVALSGAIAQQAALDQTATNLANASTDGYQRVRTVFREALAQASQAGGPTGAVTSIGTSLDTTRGTIRATGNALDVALPDKTYLAVSTPNGERFTRAGTLGIAPDGTLKSARGGPLLSDDGRTIKTVPGDGEIKLTPSGEVWQGDTKLARLRLVSFQRPDLLSPEGATLLNATAPAGPATPATGDLSIGSIEESNTSVVGSMTDLITASRSFDAFETAIAAFREADQKIVTTVPSDQ